MEDEKEIINPEDKDYADGHLMRVCLWSGAGYSLSEFYVYVRGDDAEYALDKTVAYCEEKGYDGLILDINYVNDMVDTDFKDDFEEFVKNDGGELSGEEDDAYYDYKDQFISEWLNYVYVDATMEGASQPYYVRGENLRIENVEEPINEAEESNTLDGIKVYMNTWGNYNEYGADLEQYGIKDGWMSIDDALAFCDKYKEDEPFINDIDNTTGFDIKVSEYSNPWQVLNGLKMIEKLPEEIGYDEEHTKDLWEAYQEYESADDEITEDTIKDFKEFVERGDFSIFDNVENDYDLGYAIIEEFGYNGINDPLVYIDEEALKDALQDDVNSQYEEDDPDWYEVDDSVVKEFIDDVGDNVESLSNWFDFEKLGRDIGFESHVCFTTNGNAVEIYG